MALPARVANAGPNRHGTRALGRGTLVTIPVWLVVLLSLALLSTPLYPLISTEGAGEPEPEPPSETHTDWRQFGQNPGHTGYTKAAIPLGKVSTKITTLEDAGSLGPILVTNNTVFIEAYDELGYAIYPPYISRKIYSMNPYLGIINWIWENTTRGRNYHGESYRVYPVIGGDSIIITDHSKIIALNLTTGRPNWVQSYDVPFNNSSDINWYHWRSSIALSGELGVTGFTNRTTTVVVAFNVSNGNQIWNYTLNETISIPTIDEQSVILTGSDGDVTSLDLSTGQELWKIKLANIKSVFTESAAPRIMGDRIYLMSQEGFYSLNKSTGNTLLDINLTNSEGIYCMAINDDSIYLGSGKGIIQIDKTDGSTKRNIQIYNSPHYEISLGGNGLVANTKDGMVYAINLADYSESWSLNISGPNGNSNYVTPLIIVDGAIFLTRYYYDPVLKRHNREIVMIVAGEADIDDSENSINHVNFMPIVMVVVLTTWAYRKRW